MTRLIRSRHIVAGAALALFVAALAAAQGPPARKPSAPTPRWPDGTVNFGAPAGQTGVWEGEEPLATDPHNYETVLGRRPRPGRIHIDNVPLQPWARALIEMRNARFLADEPYTRCKPSPGPRSFGTAYGVELLNVPRTNRVYLFMTGGTHSYREVFMDGRTHPHDVEPSYFGHSIGWWEGDTLVIDTVGFNEQSWMERWGMVHTDRLHTIERVTRPDFNTLNYEVTIDDPGAYTAPWTSGYTKQWQAGTEIFEYVCQQNNYGPQLMVGVADGEQRGTVSFVP
jgi:hypothetical protein